MYEFNGKGVLVTGAAGDIGAAIARAFLDRGANVHVTDLDAEKLTARVNTLAPLGRISQSTADLAVPEEVARLAADAAQVCGQIDILVNNAAVQAQGDLSHCTLQLFDQAYAVNVRAPYLLARALVPAMQAAGGGAIINIASVHATAPGPQRLAYATTKTALLGLTRSLAVDLGAANIRVNAVSPGATLTEQLRSAWETHASAGEEIMAHAVKQHPLGRIAEVADIAEAVLYLASTRFVHGIELRVDGGFLADLRLLPRAAP